MLDIAKITDPVTSAKIAKLHYTRDTEPGITRKRRGKYFSYYDVNGLLIKDSVTLERIKRLAIPPAYTQVWICCSIQGHLQATGRDAKGRKQYRYHPAWRAIREQTKYHHIMAFAQALPVIRRQIAVDLALPGLPKQKILATVVKLLDSTLIRVGNIEYSRYNKSYGLTTLRKKHIDVAGASISFDFRGKSGKDWSIKIFDKKIAKVIQRCEEIPGQQLFKYLDENGDKHGIDSHDVNNYLQEISGLPITAKDFRTWAGTVLATVALKELANFDSMQQAKKNVVQAIETVAKRLGNTPSICRKCYIHPQVIASYLDGNLQLQQQASKLLSDNIGVLSPEEIAVLTWLNKGL
jgi:DNA topoisomerase-1